MGASSSYIHTNYANDRYGTPSQEWVLVYRASRDGFEARQFHSACDEKGATVVLVKVYTCHVCTVETAPLRNLLVLYY